jgi:hypothetical protein
VNGREWLHVARHPGALHVRFGNPLGWDKSVLVAVFRDDQHAEADAFCESMWAILKEALSYAMYKGAEAEREGTFKDDEYVEEIVERPSVRFATGAEFVRMNVATFGGEECLVADIEPRGLDLGGRIVLRDKDRYFREGLLCIDVKIQEPIVLGEAEIAAIRDTVEAIHEAEAVRHNEEKKKDN